MKINQIHFEEYINKNAVNNLHSKIKYNYPDNIKDLKNIIFYGPSGVGKYTQMLSSIKKYSPSNLKYEKRITIVCNKNEYTFKISDIHFEIDMSLLGCNAKSLWNEIYKNIIDIVLAKQDNTGIIVCKYFHTIHSELLDIFYSYMQTISNLPIKLAFILITESIGFLPNNIINQCKLIRIPRPSRQSYKNCINGNIKQNIKLNSIINIKNFNEETKNTENYNIFYHEKICDSLIRNMINIESLDYKLFRDKIYDIFIFNFNISESLWYIINYLITNKYIPDDKIYKVYLKMIQFLQYYNNNYRPIFHLENYLLYLTSVIHGFQ